jgi:cyclin-dependent kinase regulatory subunit CKS1
MDNLTESLAEQIDYSEKYSDGKYEYRHVILPKEMLELMPRGRLLTEEEWRGLHIRQSLGWEHYAIFRPEPNILLMRRPLGTNPTTGQVDDSLKNQAERRFEQEYGMEEN